MWPGVRVPDPVEGARSVTRQRHRPPLFCGFWQTLDGRRLQRASAAELGAAGRLYRRYRWLRERQRPA
jgi:hypothetical protein